MSNTLRVIWLAAVGVFPPSGAWAQSGLAESLRSAFAAVPHAETRVGVCVLDLSTRLVVFEHAAEQPLVPASSHKLFVMAAAIAELGPDFAFRTALATDRTNLYVIGDGDPAFGDEKGHGARGEMITADFDRWADALLTLGVQSVPGDIVIDESIFDDQWVHPSWDEEDLDNWYAAPVGGLNFNDNCIDITVSPAGRPGAPVLVSHQPDTRLIQIINNCRSGGEGSPILHHLHDTFEYRITGSCKKRWTFVSVSFPDPGRLFADSLRTALARKGVTVTGTIRRERERLSDGRLPASLTVVAVRSTSLLDVLRRAGKDSQNLFAECLLKRAGYAWARRAGLPDPRGSWKFGANAVHQLVERAGIERGGLVVADGSGLSRDNACTARQLAALLAWMLTRPEGTLLFDSLSVAGVDGSLRRRLRDMPGRVHAKTGTMRGIRALAGYVNGEMGPKYAFAVLFNGFEGPSTPYREIQDRFCRILADAEASQGSGSR